MQRHHGKCSVTLNKCSVTLGGWAGSPEAETRCVPGPTEPLGAAAACPAAPRANSLRSGFGPRLHRQPGSGEALEDDSAGVRGTVRRASSCCVDVAAVRVLGRPAERASAQKAQRPSGREKSAKRRRAEAERHAASRTADTASRRTTECIVAQSSEGRRAATPPPHQPQTGPRASRTSRRDETHDANGSRNEKEESVG